MNSSVRRLLSPAAAATLALGMLAACAPEESAEFDGTDNQQAATEVEEPEGSTDEADVPDGADDSDEAASDTAADDDDTATDDEAVTDDPGDAGNTSVRGPQEAVETLTYDVPNDNLQVTVGLHDLQVQGEVMRLDLSFTPEGGRSSSYSLWDLAGNSRVLPLLNDRENLKQYSVLRGGPTDWSSETDASGTKIESGQTLMYYAYYAAPEDDIDTINISVIDGLVEFADVEIQR